MMSGLPPPGGGNKTVQMVDTNSIVKTEANLPIQTPTSQVIQVQVDIILFSSKLKIFSQMELFIRRIQTHNTLPRIHSNRPW